MHSSSDMEGWTSRQDQVVTPVIAINHPDSIDEGYVNDYSDVDSSDRQYLQREITRSSRSRSRDILHLPQGRSRSYSSTRSVIAPKQLTIWTLTKEQKIVLLVVATSDLLTFLSVSLMGPFFPEEALAKGVSDTLSGWIFGISPFVQFIMSPVVGKLLPHAGVKFTFISGMFLFSGCTILFGMMDYVSTDDSIAVFVLLAFLLQIVKSVGVACVSTASFVVAVTTFPDNISTVFGFSEIFVGLGLVSGPGIGGLLYGLDGFYLPFITIGGLGMLSIPGILFLLPEIKDLTDYKKDRISLSHVFCCPLGIIISISIIASTFTWSILDPTLEPFLRKFDLSPEMVGVIFLVMAATYSLSAPLWGWISDKLDDQRGLLIVGFLFAAIGSLLIGPCPLLGLDAEYHQLWLVIVALVILGCSASLSSIPTFDAFFTLADEKGCEDDTTTYSMVAGVWLALYSLGDFIGPSLGGFLSDTIGFNNMCTVTAVVCVCMVFLLSVSWVCQHSFCQDTTKSELANTNFNNCEQTPLLID